MPRSEQALILLVSAALLLFMVSCGGGGGGSSTASDDNANPSNEVTITGSFTGGAHASSSWMDSIFDVVTKSAFALDAAQVSKVLIFTAGTYSYQIANVTEGSFSVNVPRSNPIGMIFVGSNNEYLGYLYLTSNIASLPMSKVKSSVATIDLGALTSSGLIVEPSNDPFGDDIPMTEEELNAYAQFNGLFSALIKHPDVDGNGTIDVLENQKYFMQIGYGLQGGRFNGLLTPTIDTQLSSYQIHFFTNKDDCPDSATLTGPEGSPYSPATSIARVQIGSYCTHRVIYSPMPGDFEVPVSGNYILDYPDCRLTFSVPDQSLILEKLIAIVPTVTLHEDETIDTVSWGYRLADGSGQPFDPGSIITQIQINISDNAFSADGLYSSALIFSTTTTEIDLSAEQIHWTDVGSVNTSYFDVFGNGYATVWNR